MAGNAGAAAVSWAALALAAAALVAALSGGGDSGPLETEDESDLASAENLESRLHDVEGRLEAAERRLSEMDPRLGRVERTAEAALGEARAAAAGGSGTTATAGGADPVPAGDAEKRAALDALVASIRSGSFSAEGAFALMERARQLGGIDEALKEMEAYAAAHGTEPGALVNLGLAYSSKLLSVPEGPERGAWAMKALQSYENALKIDPDHWEARFQRAFNLSQWPPYLNRQPESIRGFEELVELQERGTPEARHVNAYIQLGNTYRAAGNSEKALEAFRRGLARFPENETLRKQVELLEKR